VKGVVKALDWTICPTNVNGLQRVRPGSQNTIGPMMWFAVTVTTRITTRADSRAEAHIFSLWSGYLWWIYIVIYPDLTFVMEWMSRTGFSSPDLSFSELFPIRH